jgi:hypothetical protein
MPPTVQLRLEMFYNGQMLTSQCSSFDGAGAGYFEEGMKWFDGSVKRQSLQEIVESSILRLT